MAQPAKDVVSQLRPATRITDRAPYESAKPPHEIDLWLNSNEGASPAPSLWSGFEATLPDLVRRYPNVDTLENLIAQRFDVSRDRLLVTAGGDDAIYRACLVMLEADRELVLPVPTFEMIERYAAIAGGRMRGVSWMRGPYPLDAVLESVGERTAMVAVVSPNNPTGAVATVTDIQRLSAEAPKALILLDLAYAEFADVDPTSLALTLPNVLVVRTMSKAWGLAGLRVGFALGPANLVRWMRQVGNPYAVSGLSAALACEQLAGGSRSLDSYVTRVRTEREELAVTLRSIGAEPLPSQANFVLARFSDARCVWEGLARRGIAVRSFIANERLSNHLRITCPGNPKDFARLTSALRVVTINPMEGIS